VRREKEKGQTTRKGDDCDRCAGRQFQTEEKSKRKNSEKKDANKLGKEKRSASIATGEREGRLETGESNLETIVRKTRMGRRKEKLEGKKQQKR